MDQKRLFAAIAISIGILLAFDLWKRETTPPPADAPAAVTQQAPASSSAVPVAPSAPGSVDARVAAQANRPAPERLKVESPRLAGSLLLRGARLDDLVLKDYRETVAPGSPLVRMFAPREELQPYFAQWGWSAADGRTRVPDGETDWTASGGPLGPDSPVTLSWDNGQGQTFQIVLSLDRNFMFQAEQRVVNGGAEPVQVLPWVRVRRETTPATAGYYILHEGFVGVLNGRLNEQTYSSAKDDATRGVALEQETTGGWAGFTDKYWLSAIAPVDTAQPMRATWRHVAEAGQDRWQVDFSTPAPLSVAPGATASLGSRVFAGAKEVHLLDAYQDNLGITNFDKAIDFGWFYFMTKPFFYALDFLFRLFGNFGIAILVFTVALKLLFFPLANKAYKSMARMKVLTPKMTEIRERYKDDPAKAQQEMMALYRTEKVNPASGCLPILIQIPVFFALYKVLFVTIEMRHAPFFGWIRDLSAPDPTNLFNLFGLIPWDPPAMLHMPVWAIIMGITMFVQQKLNPTPPDPIQAKIFTWMPVIFTFMLASFPAGLVIYWSWNNLLSVAQQWYIMRHERAARRQEKALSKTAKAKG
ncbi:membrane protein insertase YidC [Pseudoroseomonas rhizosphaerae]|uniref:Membrane protein insertase YidC n=1 Tax=Teichococcus rhizosphaerae TaxID=1335062 RepID=A0A2C7AIG2_9PROT|nr:membrane protein insertase YidC [Pseudoroseomonas rhizosphaerae]PHK96944.1 membrane protein insertase YidC [Pseudoroseomonas rhizosphaerae]